jgi:hypothetical protein
MPTLSVVVTPAEDQPAPPAAVLPMFACAGCRPAPLGYASFAFGDGLETMLECPARELCTWYAGHDFGGATEFHDLPAASRLPSAFQLTPYFSCANFDDHRKFLASIRRTKLTFARRHVAMSQPRKDVTRAQNAALTAAEL